MLDVKLMKSNVMDTVPNKDGDMYHGEACNAWPVQRQTYGYLPSPQSITAVWPVPNYTEVTRCLAGSR